MAQQKWRPTSGEPRSFSRLIAMSAEGRTPDIRVARRGSRLTSRPACSVWWGCLVAVIVVGVLLASSGARGASGGGFASFEVDVADGVGAGEPEMAIDSVHGTLVIAFSASQGCWIAVSANQGRTWRLSPHPADPGPTQGDPYHYCSDPAAASGPGGALYVGAGWWDTPVGAVNYYNMYVSPSTDGGMSWGPSVFATGDREAAQNLALGRNSGHTDREFLTVDNRTGTVYASAVDFPRLQRWLVASHDRGRTFGQPHAIDSAAYPEAGGQAAADYIPAAAYGRVAVTYAAAPVPGLNHCPCNVFETSKDDGVTWLREISPVDAQWTAADPSHPGRYAVMSGNGFTARTSTPDSIVVSMTSDYGKTWSKPVDIGQNPPNQRYQPWINYSPTGVLGVGYKTVYADGTYEYWAAVSYDGGRTFAAPLRLSHAVSPPEGPDHNGSDDFSYVSLDRRYLYAAWADMRHSTGSSRSLYFARMPLSITRQVAPACSQRRRMRFALGAHAGDPVLIARGYVDGRLRARAHGKRLRSLVVSDIGPNSTVRIVTLSAHRVWRITTRRYRNCVDIGDPHKPKPNGA